MSQLPGNMPLRVGENDNTLIDRDSDISGEALPSAGHSSGLTPAVRQHLDERFQASGSADALVNELRAQIAEIDARSLSEDDPDHARVQAQRALFAQVSYVEDDLAVHGIRSDRVSTTERDEWQEDGSARSVGEPIASASARRSRRVRVYDSTADR